VNSDLTITAYVTIALLEAGLQVKVQYGHLLGYINGFRYSVMWILTGFLG
jgi:hypothetical protein